MAGDFDVTLAVFKDGVNNLPASALGVLHRGALAACDGKDGVSDGVIEDPRSCSFDPGTLSCQAGQAADHASRRRRWQRRAASTPASRTQRAASRSILGLRPAASRTGRTAIPANPFPIPISHYKWLVFADSKWDWKSFDFSDPAGLRVRSQIRGEVCSDYECHQPGSRAFRARGGKLLQYHGWNDQLITPFNSINYYESVLTHRRRPRSSGNDCRRTEFYRLFMAPGMAHCGGGSGPNNFDMQTVLERWIEQGTAPDRIVRHAGDQRRRRSSPSVVRRILRSPSTGAAATPTTRQASSAAPGKCPAELKFGAGPPIPSLVPALPSGLSPQGRRERREPRDFLRVLGGLCGEIPRKITGIVSTAGRRTAGQRRQYEMIGTRPT